MPQSVEISGLSLVIKFSLLLFMAEMQQWWKPLASHLATKFNLLNFYIIRLW